MGYLALLGLANGDRVIVVLVKATQYVFDHLSRFVSLLGILEDDFEIKLLRFAFVAIHVQQIVRFLRKKIPDFRDKGFISIQRILNSDPDFLDLLQNLMKVRVK